MDKNKLILVSALFFAGLLSFCVYHEWIIFHIPTKNTYTQELGGTSSEKKMVSFFFWKENKWHKEGIEILWSSSPDKALQKLIDRWLTLLNEENLMDKKITLQDVALSQQGQSAYISFDRSLFSNESSTLEKLMLVEGLLRTVQESGSPVASLSFLVHHKVLKDAHLDFSSAWPVTGYTFTK